MSSKHVCPHCGGGEGYKFTQTEVWVYSGGWDESPEIALPYGAGMKSVLSTTLPVCLQCGKRVKHAGEEAEL